MAQSIKRQAARELLALLKDSDVPAIRKIDIAELIKSLLERPKPKAENVGLDSK